MPTPEDRAFFEDLNDSLANSLESAISDSLGNPKNREIMIDMQSIRMIGTVFDEALKRNYKREAAGTEGGGKGGQGKPGSPEKKEEPLGTGWKAITHSAGKLAIVASEFLAASKIVGASTRALQAGMQFGDIVARTAVTTSNLALLKEQSIGESVGAWGKTIQEMGASMEGSIKSGVRNMNKEQMQFGMRMEGLGVSMGAMNNLTTNQNQLLGRSADSTRNLGNDMVDLSLAQGTFADAVIEAANAMIDFQKGATSTMGAEFGAEVMGFTAELTAKMGGAFKADMPALMKGLIKTDLEEAPQMQALAGFIGMDTSMEAIQADPREFLMQALPAIAAMSQQAQAAGPVEAMAFNKIMKENFGVTAGMMNTILQIDKATADVGGVRNLSLMEDVKDEERAAKDEKIKEGILGHSFEAQKNMVQFNVAVDNLNETFMLLDKSAWALKGAMDSFMRDAITKSAGGLGLLGGMGSLLGLGAGGSLLAGLLKNTGIGGKARRTAMRQRRGGGGLIDRMRGGSFVEGDPSKMNRAQLRELVKAEGLDIKTSGKGLTNEDIVKQIDDSRAGWVKKATSKIPKPKVSVKGAGKVGLIAALGAGLMALMGGDDEEEAVKGAGGGGGAGDGGASPEVMMEAAFDAAQKPLTQRQIKHGMVPTAYGTISGSGRSHDINTGKPTSPWTYKGTGMYKGKEGAQLALEHTRAQYLEEERLRDKNLAKGDHTGRRFAASNTRAMKMLQKKAAMAIHGGGAEYGGSYTGWDKDLPTFDDEISGASAEEAAVGGAAEESLKGGGLPPGVKGAVGLTLGTTAMGAAQAVAEKKAISKAGSVAAYKASLKAGKKGIGKSLLKKLPVIGLIAGLGFGISRAMQGDWAGAGLEVMSGAASMVPGAGTAASVAIDAGLVARDVSQAMDGAEQTADAAIGASESEDTAPKTALEAIAENTARLVEVSTDSRGIQEQIAARPVAAQPEGVYNNTNVMAEIEGDIESLVDAGLD